MKSLWKIIARQPFLIISLVLLVLLVLQRECAHNPSCPGSDTLTTVSATTDTLIITHNHYLPLPPPDTVIHTDTLFPDTAAILADYSALKIYNRTLLDDSTAHISLVDSVQFNAIRGSQFTAVLFQKHTVETVTHTVYQPEPPRIKVFTGFMLGYSFTDIPLIAPQLSLLTRNNHLYTLGYDPFNKTFYFSNTWKIQFLVR
jgi:hypothetical protein